MKASLAHVSINVRDVGFYRKLTDYLGFNLIANYKYGFGASDGTASLWVFKTAAKYRNRGFHRKATGLNHVAFRVGSREAVDAFYANYILANGLNVLYGGPAEYAEYTAGYYAVYFEDPDRIKLEVAYIPESDS